MALEPLPATRLAQTPTVFASFMGHAGMRHRTVAQLLAIYREHSGELDAAEDRADDLRVERFMADMRGSRWRDEVVVRIGVFGGIPLVVDGIHRAIAYLGCVEQGIAPAALPALCVEL